MKITKEEILEFASKASLALSSDEVTEFTDDFDEIIALANNLKDVDTANAGDIQTAGTSNVLREDIVKPSMDKEDVLANAPEKKDGCFFVPAVME